MKDWRKLLIAPDASICDAMAIIDSRPQKICLVVDGDGTLLGTITDGDIRRGMLRRLSVDAPVSGIMNVKPRVGNPGDDRESLLALSRSTKVRQIPLVDHGGRVVGMATQDELEAPRLDRPNWVVLMAGGLGTRLRPLTETTPKPMIKVGTKPVLERILESLVTYGFRNFYMAVNYKSEMVMDHFGDGSRWGVDIRYLLEDSRRGTAGPLALIKDPPTHPIIVMNGDVLTQVPFDHLIDFHGEVGAKATMCVREYEFQVPYGVVQLDGHRILAIDEKPLNRFFVNAGIYVLDPAVVARVPDGVFYDMPQLFEELMPEPGAVAAFPIREYWLDIGQMDDLTKARADFADDP